jgi:hypothetical protein
MAKAGIGETEMNGDDLATHLMASGGDARITLGEQTGLNRYFSAPRRSDVLAYASSTANDISAALSAMFQPLARPSLSGREYAEALEGLRQRIRRAYSLPEEGGDRLRALGDRPRICRPCLRGGPGAARTHNVLLGADEVGSGCIYSAFGQYFAESTALGLATKPGTPVAGLGDTHVEMIDIPVRDAAGRARPSSEIAGAVGDAVAHAGAAGRHPLVHVVHGSKTGLILPALDDLDRLRREHGTAMSFVVDACQARITSAAIADYLARDAIVFITGSKFMGAPPFSAFALVPPGLAVSAAPLRRPRHDLPPGGVAF